MLSEPCWTWLIPGSCWGVVWLTIRGCFKAQVGFKFCFPQVAIAVLNWKTRCGDAELSIYKISGRDPRIIKLSLESKDKRKKNRYLGHFFVQLGNRQGDERSSWTEWVRFAVFIMLWYTVSRSLVTWSSSMLSFFRCSSKSSLWSWNTEGVWLGD